MKTQQFASTLGLILLTACVGFPVLAADDEDLHYQVVSVQGHPMVYRDETDETSRLHKGQSLDDGDKITTDGQSKVVLRLKTRAYVFIAPHSLVKITRLNWSDNKRLQSRFNLIYGRILTQISPGPHASFEVSMGKLLCRAHGTVFDVARKKEEVKITAFEGGSVVATAHGAVELARPRQILKYDNARFRYKHYLKTEDEGRLEDWKDTLSEIRAKHTR